MNAETSIEHHRPHRIAVVEDDHHLRQDLLDFLKWKGFDAVGCDSAEAFDRMPQRDSMDLVLLDIGLSGRSGLDLARELREQVQAPGIVMLTSFGTDADCVKGLQLGADAYLVKSASMDVIVATCESVIRRLPERKPSDDPSADTSPHWQLDILRSALVPPGGQPMPLTHMESVFLRALLSQPGHPVTREALLLALHKPINISNLRNLDNCATRLRRKVAQVAGLDLPLRSRYGQGYVFGGPAHIAEGTH